MALNRGLNTKVRCFVSEVTESLVNGKPHRTPGFGTFSTCVRKGVPGRAASPMAMFRAANELRAFASEGPLPEFSGPHAEVVCHIAKAMKGKAGIEIAHLGRMAVVPMLNGKPKLIFHGASELNSLLALPAQN